MLPPSAAAAICWSAVAADYCKLLTRGPPPTQMTWEHPKPAKHYSSIHLWGSALKQQACTHVHMCTSPFLSGPTSKVPRSPTACMYQLDPQWILLWVTPPRLMPMRSGALMQISHKLITACTTQCTRTHDHPKHKNQHGTSCKEKGRPRERESQRIPLWQPRRIPLRLRGPQT